MPVPSLITDLATVAATNSPLGSESPATADDYFRAHASFIAQLRAVFGGAVDANIPNTISIGVGQTWQNMVGSRALGATYTNSTGRTIELSVSTLGAALGQRSGLDITVSGLIVFEQAIPGATGLNAICAATVLIPPGATYIVSAAGSGSTVYRWTEIR